MLAAAEGLLRLRSDNADSSTVFWCHSGALLLLVSPSQSLKATCLGGDALPPAQHIAGHLLVNRFTAAIHAYLIPCTTQLVSWSSDRPQHFSKTVLVLMLRVCLTCNS